MSSCSVNLDDFYSTFTVSFHDNEFDMLSVLDIGVICLDENDRVTYLNSTFNDLTGVMEGQILGKDLDQLRSSANNGFSALFSYLISAGKRNGSEGNEPVKIVTSDGSLKYFYCKGLSFFDDKGIYKGRAFFLNDETIKTVCSNKCSFEVSETLSSHFPFVSFLWKGDDAWSVEYVSDNVMQFGYDPGDMMSEKISYADIVHPDHVESVRQAVNQLEGNHFSREYKLITADGQSRWVVERSYAVRDRHDRITHFHGAVLDIDERKKFEQELELRNKEEKALSLLGEKAISCSDINDLMNYAVKLISDTLDVSFCTIMERLPDERFLLRYGYGVSDWCIGSVIVDRNEGSNAGYTLFSGKGLVIQDIDHETRFKVPRFLYEHGVRSGVSVIIGSKDGYYGVLCIHSELEREYVEHEINFLQSASNILADTIRLRETFNSLELYRNLMNQSNDHIMLLNAVSRKIIYVSDRLLKDLGYSRSEMMEFDMFETGGFINGIDMPEVVRKLADSGSLIMESELTRRDGSSFPVDISFTFAENAGCTYIVLIGRDISERKVLERSLREHSEQLESSNELKNMFADIISHDLTSSVALIEGFADYLHDIEEDEDKRHILENINRGTSKLRSTIDSASVFARLTCSEDMELEILDLREMFYNAFERLHDKAEEKDIELAFDSPGNCPCCANTIIEEVFFNLISNAIKYSPSGSRVVVDIKGSGDRWKVQVSDSGPGISDEDKQNIFERFKRAGSSNVKGKGLGLAIARMALRCHDEELYVSDNGSGKGSIFWFHVKMSSQSENLE